MIWMNQISFCLGLFVLFAVSSFAHGRLTELDLHECNSGDSITWSTYSGQGHDTIEVTKKVAPDLCELKYESELERGVTDFVCRFKRQIGKMSSRNFSRETCVRLPDDTQPTNLMVPLAGETWQRKKFCIDFPVASCPHSRCLVLKDCSGHEFCIEDNLPDPGKCGAAGTYGQKVKCCPGLQPHCPGISVVPDGPSTQPFDVPICLNCGNKICEPMENKNNCPQDCP